MLLQIFSIIENNRVHHWALVQVAGPGLGLGGVRTLLTAGAASWSLSCSSSTWCWAGTKHRPLRPGTWIVLIIWVIIQCWTPGSTVAPLTGDVSSSAVHSGGAPWLVVSDVWVSPGALMICHSMVDKREDTRCVGKVARLSHTNLSQVSPGSLTTIILGVEIMSKLFTIVAPAHQVSLAPFITIMLTSITRSITVSLSLITGILRCAASLAIIVPAPASLASWRQQWYPRLSHCHWIDILNCLGQVTAVILGMIICSKLETVVSPTHQVTSTTIMTIIGSSVKWSITITFSIATWLLWCATSSVLVIPPRTPLTWRRF